MHISRLEKGSAFDPPAGPLALLLALALVLAACGGTTGGAETTGGCHRAGWHAEVPNDGSGGGRGHHAAGSHGLAR